MKGTLHPLYSLPRGRGAAHSPRLGPPRRHLELVLTSVPPLSLTCRRWTWDPGPRGVPVPEPPTRIPLSPNEIAPCNALCPALGSAGPEGAAGCPHEVWPDAAPRERGLSRECVLGSLPEWIPALCSQSYRYCYVPLPGGGPEFCETPGSPCVRIQHDDVHDFQQHREKRTMPLVSQASPCLILVTRPTSGFLDTGNKQS